MVKFSHSVFALPFALTGAVLAAARYGLTWRQIAWVIVAMVAARNAAMGFNRLVDHAWDAQNPRTSARELPRGILSRQGRVGVHSDARRRVRARLLSLNSLCGALSPLALLIVFSYSLTKRFTWASTSSWGCRSRSRPIGGWLAIAGRLRLDPGLARRRRRLLGRGLRHDLCCQDVDFDRSAGLFSIPARFGVPKALALARAFHVVAVGAMAAVGISAGLHGVYWIGLLVVGGVLVFEHRLVRAE
jgi:4-hydroxybenzoate polyprenyltransferase